jgi:ABC-type Fe3+ transport system permease subunit
MEPERELSTAQRPSAILRGALAFFVTLAVGLALTAFVIRSIPPTVPHPTETYEGFGDALIATLFLYAGAALSLLLAGLVSAWVAWPRNSQA